MTKWTFTILQIGFVDQADDGEFTPVVGRTPGAFSDQEWQTFAQSVVDQKNAELQKKSSEGVSGDDMVAGTYEFDLRENYNPEYPYHFHVLYTYTLQNGESYRSGMYWKTNDRFFPTIYSMDIAKQHILDIHEGAEMAMIENIIPLNNPMPGE